MTTPEKPIDEILDALKERAKELNCLYVVDELLSRLEDPIEDVMADLVRSLPDGWQYPDVCEAVVTVDGETYRSSEFSPTDWFQRAEVLVEHQKVGEVTAYYTSEKPAADEGPFLKEERRLIDAIAERIGVFILQRRLRSAHRGWADAVNETTSQTRQEWQVILDFLRRTDHALLARITRKMINYLCWSGTDEAGDLLQEFVFEGEVGAGETLDENRPMERKRFQDLASLADRTFAIAANNCSESEIVGNIKTWIEEEKVGYLVEALENPHSTLTDIASAIERFELSQIDESNLPAALQKSLRVSLLRRFFTNDLGYLRIMKNHVKVADFNKLLGYIVYPSWSHGRLGGKSSGLFMAAHVVRESKNNQEIFKNIKVPKTWYVSSDSLLEFIHYNNLEDVYDRKYMDIQSVRQDYPHIVQVFKNSIFPPEISKGLAVALDDFKENPLIVRSSSLLEDQVGSAFAGKYKSLFVANQGSKKERLEALQDAIAEVYASIFGPDPIEYRAERELLDVHEEMAIMIQEVVGDRIGRYFLPAYAGVAFSQNEFRWSPRIKRDDGLVRMVPGLGTRAVDRLSDDYPVLFAPGQPGLRVNVTPDEVIRYSPQKVDVINLENNSFETVSANDLFRETGEEYPLARKIVSMFERDRIRKPVGLEPEWEKDDFVVTFQGLIDDGSFVERIRVLMDYLQENTNFPVDIEFAADGENLYLLQCRAQSASPNFAPAPIPRDLPREKVVFTANRYVSNGRVPDITHIVYVDPERYNQLSELKDLKDVGRAVSKLNKLLPKRQFILIGPGRWGSRGDIKLGVGVTYSDINNTSVLLEIARMQGNYLPELSFGTHFFQDLVEADIRYLPLYPDEEGIIFNNLFLSRAKSILKDLLPGFAHLDETVRVIDVPSVANGQIVKVLMNADLDEAVGILSTPSEDEAAPQSPVIPVEESSSDHWRWRLRMAESIAMDLDAKRYGVKGVYVFGSTKNAAAGPASDLDLIVHHDGNKKRREELSLWLDGWSRSLAEVNYLRTGYKSDGLLDVHFVTDEDIAKNQSYASKIGAVTDPARPLQLGPREQ